MPMALSIELEELAREAFYYNYGGSIDEAKAAYKMFRLEKSSSKIAAKKSPSLSTSSKYVIIIITAAI